MVLELLASYSEEQLVERMCYCMLLCMSGAFLALSLGVTAPYGRYSGDMSLGE
jgi:hypothetical protein